MADRSLRDCRVTVGNIEDKSTLKRLRSHVHNTWFSTVSRGIVKVPDRLVAVTIGYQDVQMIVMQEAHSSPETLE